MRALLNRGSGRPEVDMAEVAEPEPGPSEVVVEVEAVAVNRGELRLMAMRPAGWRPGQDVAGRVVKPAADGSGPETGARVVAWPEQGGWAERVAVPTTHLGLLADRVGHAEAATLPIAGVTALRLLRRGGSLLGGRVLVTGAAGGVGRFAVELAGRGGAEVTAIARDAERASGLADLGASTVLDEIGAAEGRYDLILESVGGASLEAAVGLVAPGGLILVFGNSSGEPAQISFADFRGAAGAAVEAFFVYESGDPPSFGHDLQLLADMVADGRLHPQVGLEVPWSEAGTAFEALARRQINGKAVLVVD